MSMPDSYPAETSPADALVAELGRMTKAEGPQQTEWSGLTVYRSSSPIGSQWDEAGSLSICLVAQGRKRVTLEGVDYMYSPLDYLIFTRNQRMQVEILEASAQAPFLGCAIRIDPATVLRVAGDVLEGPTLFPSAGPTPTSAGLSRADPTMVDAVVRFLVATTTSTDRRILAPMYLKEITYRLMQTAQCGMLLEAAAAESGSDLIASVIGFIRSRMAERLTVNDLADHVSMSTSAFAHLFRDTAGISPYQFIKRMRLDEARRCLAEGEITEVGIVARKVGYTSLSHFIDEFKRHFGVTPSAYAAAQRQSIALQVYKATRSNRFGLEAVTTRA